MKRITVYTLAAATALSACAGTDNSIILDGPPTASYQRDLAECRQLSLQHAENNTRTTGGAVLGGLVGASDAKEGDELEGAVVGALLGAAFGRGKAVSDRDAKRAEIVRECLRGRGQPVVG